MSKLRMYSGVPILVVITLCVLVAPASGTTVTATSGTEYTPTIEAKTEGPTTLDGILDVTCNSSSVKGSIESHGASVTAKGNVSSLTFGECNGDTVEVKKAGLLEIHATGGGNGTVTSSGAEITIVADTIFGNIHCIFTTSATHIGRLTGAASSTGQATLDLDSASIPRTGGTGSGLCGSSGEWTGSYKVSSPVGLTVEAAGSGSLVTAPHGATTTGTIKAVSDGMRFDSKGYLGDIECDEAAFEGKVETHGAGVTAKANLRNVTFSSCQGDQFIAKFLGVLEFHAIGKGNATVTWSGAEITIVGNTVFGALHCILTTSNTHIGTLTGNSSGTGHATLHLEGAAIPRTGGTSGGLCASSSEWTGSYKFTSPTGLTVDS